MNPETGKIVEFGKVEDLDKEQKYRAIEGKPQLVQLQQKANPKCNKCNGKGQTGRNVDTGLYQVCKCTFKKKQ